MKAFFKLVDHRTNRTGCMMRLAEIIAVNDPVSSHANEWSCTVVVRSGECYSIGGTMDTVYRERDKLLHALELDASRGEPAPVAGVDTKLNVIEPDPRCSAVLKAQGKAYPRTCPVHGLAPCPPAIKLGEPVAIIP